MNLHGTHQQAKIRIGRRMRRPGEAAALPIALVFAACIGEDAGSAAGGTGESRMAARTDIEAIARGRVTLDAPQLHEEYVRELLDTGRRLRVFTYIDGRGGKETVAIDEAARTAVDLQAAVADEERALHRRCGKLNRALCDELAHAAASAEPIPVVVWLAHPEGDLDRAMAEHDPIGFEMARNASVNARRATVDGVASRIERVLGRRAFERSRFAPVLAGQLSRAEIAAVAADAEVGAVLLGGRDPVQDLAHSMSLAGWSSDTAYDGSGINVGVLEMYRPDVVSQLPPLTIRLPAGATDAHSRLVTAMIANTTTTPGFANAATMFIANLTSPDIPITDVSDVDWAHAQATRIHNQSWHFPSERTTESLSARDRYLDYMTRVHALFYSTAASNRDDRLVVHKGYNIVTVGATYTDGSIVDGTQPDNCSTGNPGTAYVSTWRNAGGGQELPHIVANGTCISAVGLTNWSGTSFSAPQIAGMAAGLVEYRSALTIWPEALKAIILASPRPGLPTPDGCPWRFRKDASGNCTLNDGRDGTGLVNGVGALNMAATRSSAGPPVQRGHDYGYITKGSFDPSTRFLTTAVHYAQGQYGPCPISLDHLRVVLAWDSKVSCTAGDPSSCTDVLEMDLDLLVYEEPGGYLIATSSTTVNSYEHVDVRIQGRTGHCYPTGTNWSYRIEVRLSNYTSLPASASTFYGIAWRTI